MLADGMIAAAEKGLRHIPFAQLFDQATPILRFPRSGCARHAAMHRAGVPGAACSPPELGNSRRDEQMASRPLFRCTVAGPGPLSGIIAVYWATQRR